MPSRPRAICPHPGCGALTDGGCCERHRRQRQHEQDQRRGGANQRGYTYRWQVASKAFLARHPLCQCPDCDEGRKRVSLATVVDHKIPHKGDQTLFWDESNWQAMAKQCHDRKTALQDGGLGRGGQKATPGSL